MKFSYELLFYLLIARYLFLKTFIIDPTFLLLFSKKLYYELWIDFYCKKNRFFLRMLFYYFKQSITLFSVYITKLFDMILDVFWLLLPEGKFEMLGVGSIDDSFRMEQYEMFEKYVKLDWFVGIGDLNYTFLDLAANLNVLRVWLKFTDAGLVVQITIVWEFPKRDGDSNCVSFESLNGICTPLFEYWFYLILNYFYFFLSEARRWITFERTKRLLLIYPV